MSDDSRCTAVALPDHPTVLRCQLPADHDGQHFHLWINSSRVMW